MSKKKVSGNTMTLKDFHGGSIPSDLPLPSAPGVIVRATDRPGYDRPAAWGNPMGRSDHRSRPHTSPATRHFDDKTPFLAHSVHIGRNFDEDERKPLDGVSAPRRIISDDSIRVAPARAEPKPVFASPGGLSGVQGWAAAPQSPMEAVSSYSERVSDAVGVNSHNLFPFFLQWLPILLLPSPYIPSSSLYLPPTNAMAFRGGNASSGMGVAEDCRNTFLELQRKKAFRYVIFKIDEKKKEVVVEKTGGPAESYDDFTGSLPENDCRYAIYDFDFVTSENCQKSKIFFIAWSPSVSRIRAKMLYATSKDRFRRELEGIHYEIQATDPTEMELEVLQERAH